MCLRGTRKKSRALNLNDRSLTKNYKSIRICGTIRRIKEKGGDMLILTRKDNESLFIGDDIEVTVLGVKGNQVRIGINAPKETPVHREEVYQLIQSEQSSKTPD